MRSIGLNGQFFAMWSRMNSAVPCGARQ